MDFPHYEYHRYAALGGQSPSQFGGDSSNLLHQLCINPQDLVASGSSDLEEASPSPDDPVVHPQPSSSSKCIESQLNMARPMLEEHRANTPGQSTKARKARQSAPQRMETRSRTRATNGNTELAQNIVSKPSTSSAVGKSRSTGKRKAAAAKKNSVDSNAPPSKRKRPNNDHSGNTKPRDSSATGSNRGKSGAASNARYQCKLCNAILSAQGALSRHLLRPDHFPGKRIECPQCPTTTTREDSMKRHWKRKHPTIPTPGRFRVFRV